MVHQHPSIRPPGNPRRNYRAVTATADGTVSWTRNCEWCAGCFGDRVRKGAHGIAPPAQPRGEHARTGTGHLLCGVASSGGPQPFGLFLALACGGHRGGGHGQAAEAGRSKGERRENNGQWGQHRSAAACCVVAPGGVVRRGIMRARPLAKACVRWDGDGESREGDRVRIGAFGRHARVAASPGKDHGRDPSPPVGRYDPAAHRVLVGGMLGVMACARSGN
jgi:hypothetical protein